MNVYSDWETIEEREVNGEALKIIEGSFGAGRDEFNPENQYQINGTLVSDGDDLIMEVHGVK